MFVDLDHHDHSYRDLYQLFIGVVNPRPIALVSSLSGDGVPNLAPYSFFNMVSGRPPVLIVCPALWRDGRGKDTLNNVRETGEFVVAVVTDAIKSQMVRSAAALPPEASEFEFAELTAAAAARIKPGLVTESPVNFECRLRQIVELGSEAGHGNVIFGDIVALHIDDGILGADGRPDPRKLRTVGRLGGKWYCTVTDPYELEIPEV